MSELAILLSLLVDLATSFTGQRTGDLIKVLSRITGHSLVWLDRLGAPVTSEEIAKWKADAETRRRILAGE